MASEALARLQATTNRFASAADFSPLTIDGGMGPKTVSAIQAALRLATSARTEEAIVSGPGGMALGVAKTLNANINAEGISAVNMGSVSTFIMQNVVGLDSALGTIGNALGLPGAASVALAKPMAVQTAIPDKSAFKVKPAADANMIDSARLWLRQLSTVGQAGVGAGALVLILFGMSRFKKKSTAIAGYRGRW